MALIRTVRRAVLSASSLGFAWTTGCASDCLDDGLLQQGGDCAEVVATSAATQGTDTQDGAPPAQSTGTTTTPPPPTGSGSGTSGSSGIMPTSGTTDDATSSATTDPGATSSSSGTSTSGPETTETSGTTEPPDTSDTTGATDPGQLYCRDEDADGFGDPSDCQVVPTKPDGHVPNDDDCDDASQTTFPGAAPLDDPTACMNDDDGDDRGDERPPNGVTPGTDCLDADPNATQCTFCNDVDMDEKGDPDACVTAPTQPPGTVPNDDDCDDRDMAVWNTCIDWGDCQLVVIPAPNTPRNPLPDWTPSQGGDQICQSLNAKPSAYLCDAGVGAVRIRGRFGLLPNAAGDDDQLGFVWGWQDARHFYMLTWRAGTAAFDLCDGVAAPRGVVIKRIHGSSDLSCADIVSAQDTANATLLAGPSDLVATPWTQGTEYAFELEHRPTDFTLTIREAATGTVIVTKNIVDATYPTGDFGAYVYSQANSCFRGFRFEAL